MRNPELWFLRSARPLMLLYICVKFHENVSNGFGVTERTRFCDRQTDRRPGQKQDVSQPFGGRHNQHVGQCFLRHAFQDHLHAYLPVENTTQFIYFSICTTIESLNESLKNDDEPTPTAAYHRTRNSYCDKQQWLRYTLFHSHASKGLFSHIYAMR